jgi:hypothetical protein
MSALQHATLKDYINLLILSAIWGTAFIGIEIALQGFSVIQLTFGRVAVATLTLLPLLFIKKITLPKTKTIWLYIGASALLNTALPFSLINYGQQFSKENLILTEEQIKALEKAKEEKVARGEIETLFPGYLGAQDTYYVGYIKGVGRIYQQTFIDTYSKVRHT